MSLTIQEGSQPFCTEGFAFLYSKDITIVYNNLCPSLYKEGGGMCVTGPCGDSYDYVNLAGDIAVWLAVAWAGVWLMTSKALKSRSMV